MSKRRKTNGKKQQTKDAWNPWYSTHTHTHTSHLDNEKENSLKQESNNIAKKSNVLVAKRTENIQAKIINTQKH